MSAHRHALKDKLSLKLISHPDESVLQRLLEISVNAHDSPWSYDIIKSCFNDNTFCLGLYLKQDLIGYAMVNVLFDESELYTIGIMRKYQGLGFGHKLLWHTLDFAHSKGASKCFLEVRVSNAVAIYLYDVYGFEITGARKNYYPATSDKKAEDAYTMACNLENLPNLEHKLEFVIGPK